MPNLWTQTTQAIYELFNGPRTVDKEFEEKNSELKIAINSINQISNLINNFHSQTSGLRSFCQNLYNNLPKAYSGNSIYIPFIVDLCDTHKKIENSYLSCCNVLKNIQINNQEWNNLNNEVQSVLAKREEARKNYDHYDEKMEKLVKERNEKLQKKIDENIKDIEKFERNDGKYKRAASDFIQLSNYSYNKMQELLDIKYKMLNPLICTLVNEEKKFFDSCSSFFNKFDNASQKLFGLDKGFQKTPINYDATKYIRAAKLLQGVNIGNLPQIKDKHKYSYNDYQNKNRQQVNNQNFNNISPNIYSNQGIAINLYTQTQGQSQNKTQVRGQSVGPIIKGNSGNSGNNNNYNYNYYRMNKDNTGNNKKGNNNKFTYDGYIKNQKNSNIYPNNNNNNNNNNNTNNNNINNNINNNNFNNSNISNNNPCFDDLPTGNTAFTFGNNNNLMNKNFDGNNFNSIIQTNPYKSQFDNPYNNNNNNNGGNFNYKSYM